jgi:Flp pilus assembly protein TadD
MENAVCAARGDAVGRGSGGLLVAALLATVVASATASARPLDDVLERWDTRAARFLLGQLPEGRPEPQVLSVQGYVSFLDGDYAAAEQDLARAASNPEAARLLPIVRASRALAGTLQRRVSPSGRIVVTYRAFPDEALVPYLFEAGDAALDALSLRLGIAPRGPVRIEVAPALDDLARVTGLPESQVRASGTVAVCKYNRIVLVSPSAFPGGYPYADTLGHELVHFLLTLEGGDRLPLWFQEATAKYLESTWRGASPGTLTRGQRLLLTGAAAQGRLIPFSSLRGSLARMPRIDDTALAFAELSSFAAFLERSIGAGTLARLAAALPTADEETAVARVAGRTLASLVETWEKTLAIEGLSDGGPPGSLPWLDARGEDGLETLAEAAADEVRLGDSLRANGRHRAAAVRYERALAGMPSPHPAVVARLAATLVDASAPDEALAAIGGSGLDDAESPLVARERGRALAAAGRNREAIEPLLAAVRSNPYDADTHETLEKAFLAIGDEARAEREHRLAVLWR